jgi:hypothetical protein
VKAAKLILLTILVLAWLYDEHAPVHNRASHKAAIAERDAVITKLCERLHEVKAGECVHDN